MVKPRTTFRLKLNSPFSVVLAGSNFYSAKSDAIVRFRYAASESQITAALARIFDLLGGYINHQWTGGIIGSADSSILNATVGFNGN